MLARRGTPLISLTPALRRSNRRHLLANVRFRPDLVCLYEALAVKVVLICVAWLSLSLVTQGGSCDEFHRQSTTGRKLSRPCPQAAKEFPRPATAWLAIP